MQITDDIWHSLSEVASNTTKYLIHEDKIPADFMLGEIQSEVYQALGYLVNSYDVKCGVPLPSYCYKYVAKLAAKALWKEYKTLNDSKKQALEEFDSRDEQEVVKHEIGDGDVDGYVGIYEHLETQDLVKELEKKADEHGFSKIFKMLKAGMPERDIADVLGMPKTTVHNKIQKFRELAAKI